MTNNGFGYQVSRTSKKLVFSTVISIITLLLVKIVNSVYADAGDRDEHMSMGSWSGVISLGIILLAFWVVVAILVANDASKRGENGLLWGILVLIMPMMGIFVYLVFIAIRSEKTQVIQATPSSQTIINSPSPSTEYIQPSSPPVTRPINYDSRLDQSVSGKIVYCTSCGSPNKITDKFCSSCGKKLPTN